MNHYKCTIEYRKGELVGYAVKGRVFLFFWRTVAVFSNIHNAIEHAETLEYVWKVIVK